MRTNQFLLSLLLLLAASWDACAAGTREKPKHWEKQKERQPWLWEVPQQQPVPDGPGRTDIDRMLQAALRGKQLQPAPPVDPETWLRRVSFVLTGLPPDPESAKALREQDDAAAREAVVARLLASPHFGERWARHWMDVMRYAESRGHEDDFLIANAWQYRDYLIRAFQSDLPYDALVREHVAGDLLPARRGPGGGNESVLGTGWAFLGEEIHNPVDLRQDECERVDNKIDVLSKAFLGLTVACARCHDHKFDPITQRDYHALSGLVLGSSFRQVRFETMEQEREVAAKLADLRRRHAPALGRAYGELLREMVAQLRATVRMQVPDGATADAAAGGEAVAGWWQREREAAAAAGPSHPLHAVARLLGEPDLADAGKFAEALARHRPGAGADLPSGAEVIADYREPGKTPWKADGPTMVAVSTGEPLVDPSGRAWAGLAVSGMAWRDAFWNRLAPAPGTEMDSGELGAAVRSGRTLRTPKFALRTGKLHYLMRGKFQVYAGVDGHIMLTGGLHSRLRAEFDTAGQWRWVTQDLSAYAGHRGHLEFAPSGDGEAMLLMVVDAGEIPAVRALEPWWPEEGVTSAEAFVASLLGSMQAVAEAMSAGRGLQGKQLALADWMVRGAPSCGLSMERVETAAAGQFRETGALSAGVRWESALAVSWADLTGTDDAVLDRGKYQNPGEVAARGLPAVFGSPLIAVRDSSGRAELAAQLTDPANPLLARVMVNRLWHHVFGRGLVATVDNFGWLGERPTHPALLDHLAWQFVRQDGWSVKKMLRRLVLTDAFARRSRAADAATEASDPGNVWLHRMPVRRLEAEAIRDAMLVVSGRFNPQSGGPPVPVPLNDFVVGRGRPAASGPLDGDGRRSIYTAVRRNFLPTMMVAFDYPTPFSAVGRRSVTNVPAQALVMLNDPFVREQAGRWAARLLEALPQAGDAERVAWLFATGLQRAPRAAELAAALVSLQEMRNLQEGDDRERTAWVEFCHGMMGASEFIYLQ
jgi:hypothetical protein